jgi:PPOX class probable F420-dependent enzyme
MIDWTSELGNYADQRLKKEEVIWLTTVTKDGMAQPNPIWFYWDGEVITVYSQPGSYRIRNIQHDPRVTLNLEGADVLGNNVVVIQGEAQLNSYQQPKTGYKEKYFNYITQIGMTFDQLVRDYSVEITIKPSKLRGTLEYHYAPE